MKRYLSCVFAASVFSSLLFPLNALGLPLCYKAALVDPQLSSIGLAYEDSSGQSYLIGSRGGHLVRLHLGTGQYTDITAMGLGTNDAVYDVNRRGDLLVGNLLQPHASVFASGAGALIPLSSPNSQLTSALFSLNDSGDSVGTLSGASGTDGALSRSLGAPAGLTARLKDPGYSVYQPHRISNDGVILGLVRDPSGIMHDSLLVPDGAGYYNIVLTENLLTSIVGGKSTLGMNNRRDLVGTTLDDSLPLNHRASFFKPAGGAAVLLPDVPNAVSAWDAQFDVRSVADNQLVMGDYGLLIGSHAYDGMIFNGATNQMIALRSIITDSSLPIGSPKVISKSGRTIVTKWPYGSNVTYVLTQQFADFNGDHTVQVDDIFAFLNAFFAGSRDADVDGSGRLSIDDLFAYLNAFFDPARSACA